MSDQIESTVAPNSVEAQALAELQKEGHEIVTGKPDEIDGEIKDSPLPPKEEVVVKDKPSEKDKPLKEELKPERIPTMVEAWKLKVAEDQKAGLEKELVDLKQSIEDSKRKGPITQVQKDDINDEIKRIAEETGADATALSKLAEVILKRAVPDKPSEDIANTLKTIKEERELEKQLNAYRAEFEKDVIPLVKEYNLSDQALSELNSTLRDYAFSETYAKVPLKDIFKIKADEFDLKSPKKSSESRGVKPARGSEVIDIDNMSEEEFAKLPPEQAEKFMQMKTGNSAWKSNKK